MSKKAVGINLLYYRLDFRISLFNTSFLITFVNLLLRYAVLTAVVSELSNSKNLENSSSEIEVVVIKAILYFFSD
jgi:hypothetical protein